MFKESLTWRGGRETGDAIPDIGPSLAKSPVKPPKPRKPTKPKLLTGTVKMYSAEKGYGFIRQRAVSVRLIQ